MRRCFLAFLATAAGIGLSAYVGGRVDSVGPDSWAPYYFSSFMQGFSALLGIALSVVMVSFQLAASHYGMAVSSRRFLVSAVARVCLGSFAVVIVGSAAALGLRPNGSACSLLAGIVMFCGMVALVLAARSLGEMGRSLHPETLIRELVCRLSRCEDIFDRERCITEMGAILAGHRDRDWHAWYKAWESFMMMVCPAIHSLPPGLERARAAKRLMQALRLIDGREPKEAARRVWGSLSYLASLIADDPLSSTVVGRRLANLKGTTITCCASAIDALFREQQPVGQHRLALFLIMLSVVLTPDQFRKVLRAARGPQDKQQALQDLAENSASPGDFLDALARLVEVPSAFVLQAHGAFLQAAKQYADL